MKYVSFALTYMPGRAKKCVQCDQCGRPLSAGGRQRVCTVRRDERQRRTLGSSQQCDQAGWLLREMLFIFAVTELISTLQ